MPKTNRCARAACALALALLSAAASAQPIGFKLHCHSVGFNPPEPLGDREGHSIAFSEFACRVEGGPLDGGMLSGSNLFEWNGPNGVGLAGSGVIRKPGGTAVYRNTEFNNTLKMTDGRVTGASGTGRGTYPVATGSAAPLAGKVYTYTFATTGPGQFLVDVKIE